MKTIRVMVEITEECADCEGTGVVYAPWCRQCGEPVNAQRWDAILERMAAPGIEERTILLPCDHPLGELEEERACQRCEGSGLATFQVDVTEPVTELLAALGVGFGEAA